MLFQVLLLLLQVLCFTSLYRISHYHAILWNMILFLVAYYGLFNSENRIKALKWGRSWTLMKKWSFRLCARLWVSSKFETWSGYIKQTPKWKKDENNWIFQKHSVKSVVYSVEVTGNKVVEKKREQENHEAVKILIGVRQ